MPQRRNRSRAVVPDQFFDCLQPGQSNMGRYYQVIFCSTFEANRERSALTSIHRRAIQQRRTIWFAVAAWRCFQIRTDAGRWGDGVILSY
jgi:hypothetical protein